MKRKNTMIYLVTIPVPLVSIFLNSTEERKEGSLQTSLVMDLNSAIDNSKNVFVRSTVCLFITERDCDVEKLIFKHHHPYEVRLYSY